MTDVEAEDKLKQCLEAMLNVVQTTMRQIKSKKISEGDSLLEAPIVDAPADTNIYSFTLDRSEEDLTMDFNRDIENILHEKLPYLKQLCKAYVLDLLNQFNYNDVTQEFPEQLNIGMLDSFALELECCLESIDGYRAALNGNRIAVQTLLKKYPMVKDKPGLWGTTLLHSAARNNHSDLVKDLVKTHQCSVNAQNHQHLLRALAGLGHADYFDNDPKAGSTALHAACFYGHLNVVRYLTEHGANYYIRNQAADTALTYVNLHENVQNYFRQLLVFGYSANLNQFPEVPIDEDATFTKIDCVWELKRFSDQKWSRFDPHNSQQLQKALIVQSGQEFQREIHLETAEGIYSVCLMKFLCVGRNVNSDENLAWIRCRGSSFVNFNCYALWQILLTKHPAALTDSSLDMIKIPVSYDSRFEIHLNTWLFCNAQTNEKLDKAMKYRRRYVNIKVPLISNDLLIFNLEEFSFTDSQNRIVGFLRWIPKMISNNSIHQDAIIDVDEYATVTNIKPIPLTTSRLNHVAQLNNLMTNENEEDLPEYFNDDDFSYEDFSNESIHRSTDKTSHTQSLSDSFNIPVPVSDQKTSIDDRIDNLMSDVEPEKPIEQCINEENVYVSSSQQPEVVEQTDSVDDKAALDALSAVLADFQQQKAELEHNLEAERITVTSLVDSDTQRNVEHEQRLVELMQRIESMEKQEKLNQTRETMLQDMVKTIRTVDYTNIQKEIMHDFLTPKNSLILEHLQQTGPNLDLSFNGRVPQMKTNERNHFCIVTLVAFQGQHNQFKEILKRIQTLVNKIKSAKDYYQRHLNRTMYSIVKGVLPQVKPRTNSWREYIQAFFQLFQNKNKEYKQLFDDYINEKLKSMIEPCILGQLVRPWNEVQEQTNQFIQNHSFDYETNLLKQKALDEFIEKNISLQQLTFESKPSEKSINTVKHFIEKVKNEFRTDRQHQGHQLEHFSRIPKLLERLLLYFSCFKIQLPLYQSADELLKQIDNYLVTTITTSTGSGKSTLLPALLIAEGYDKVIVTQPRRLPCQLICQRVNETMRTDTGKSAKQLAGWAISGVENNPQAKILYLTDGLLKERLLYDKQFLTKNTNLDKSVVFFIDEVHERSVNIDLCLALLARLVSDKPELHVKVKIIISSATLDATVPRLFRQHLREAVSEFHMPNMDTRFPVKKISRPNENIIDVVLEICKKRKRHDQILCFVSSTSEVNRCCRLINEISRGTVQAYPLVQGQHPNVQQTNIEHGTLFFSTTIAETSLTFPCLKYVVDTGMINIPVYDIQSRQTILKEVRAAESTLKQRAGRLGRTQPGEYYSLYQFQPHDCRFPTPQICQSDLINLEFSLRRSPLRQGLNYLKRYLPDSPSPQSIDATIQQLKQLNILDNSYSIQFTAYGKELAKLPDFSSLAMSKAMLAALKYYHCGHDLICLASFLGVLNTTTIFRSIPQRFKSSDGDFMTLLNVMNEILSVKQSSHVRSSDIDYICQVKSLTGIQHLIKQVLKRYSVLENSFKLSSDFREQAQQKSGDWELIAKSLLTGFSENVFISMKDLQDRIHYFVRHNNRKDIAVLDLQSTLLRPIDIAPVSLVLARDVRRSTAIREKAILSFVGEIKPQWIDYRIKRELDVNNEEESYLRAESRFDRIVSKFTQIVMNIIGGKIVLDGSSGDVLNAEFHLRQQMIREMKFTLQSLANPNIKSHENFELNLQSLMKMPRIFDPLIWRRKAQNQAEIQVNMDPETKACKITVLSRDSVNKEIKAEFKAFIGWLQSCAVIRHPNAGLSPRVLRPQMRFKCRKIEERIARVTDSKRTPIDLYNGTKGAEATRETRMEVVAWIAICKFGCRLEGGFVRDWIVGNNTPRSTTPLTNPRDWIEYNGKIPAIKKEVVPCDLDCHLPSRAYFDIEKFQDELYKYGITCSVVPDYWRYVLLFDENEPKGPFTMDLIEPHVALTQDRIDFDVNNLYVEKDYTHELGMRIDITGNPYSIELETVIDNIQHKRFQLLRQRDKKLNDRIEKMVQIRGWKKIDRELSVIPEPHRKHYKVLVPLYSNTVLYKEIETKMIVITKLQIQSIEEIRNPYLEDIYEGLKEITKKQCPGANPNERLLFHGTKDKGIEGIAEDGFDDRYFAAGMYGRGAYFADNPLKSHGYTAVNETDGTRVMFYSKVILGKPHELTAAESDRMAAPVGCHSVIGRHSPQTEYIVYRYGQALPYLKIVYKV